MPYFTTSKVKKDGSVRRTVLVQYFTTSQVKKEGSVGQKTFPVRRFLRAYPDSLLKLVTFLHLQQWLKSDDIHIAFRGLKEGEVLVAHMRDSSYIAEVRGRTYFSGLYVCNPKDEPEFMTTVYPYVFAETLNEQDEIVLMQWRFYRFQRLQLVPYVEEGLF